MREGIKTMKILCIYSVEQYPSVDQPLPSFSDISFGISSIATVLKKAGHTVLIKVCTPHPRSLSRIEAIIKNDRPQLLCLTAVTSQYPLVKKIGSFVKGINPKINIIIGGHHATLNPESTIQEPFFNAICIGEGEEAVANYAYQIEQGNQPTLINNLWIKNTNSGKIEKNPQSTFIQDLDNLPFVDRSLWEKFIVDKNRMHTILVGRGCPNKCTYCSNHILRNTGQGKYVRYRSPENIISELSFICDNYEVSTIHLEAETLSIDINYTIELCNALKAFNGNRTRPISFGANFSMTRSIVGNSDIIVSLRNANFNFINIGLESGSERVRNDIMLRPRYSNSEIIDFCSLVREYGICVNLFVLIGVPGETYSDYKKTIDCVRLCAPEHAFVSIYRPYPGTDLFNEAKRQGLITETNLNTPLERRKATLNLPNFPKKQIQKEYIIFAYRAYKNKKPLYNIAIRVIHAYISTKTNLNRLYRSTIRHPILRKIQSRIVNMSK
jgi:radical SAM superfamily enzyme YgiQ (UPF0313 family)